MCGKAVRIRYATMTASGLQDAIEENGYPSLSNIYLVPKLIIIIRALIKLIKYTYLVNS
jgi:hypothetical protein